MVIKVAHNNTAYKANYWNQNNDPSQFSGDYAQWKVVDVCSGGGVVENEIPTVALTSPSSTAVIAEGETVLLSANALDSDGTVASVSFAVDGVVVATATQAPYEAAWVASSGTHTISVTALDNEGATSLENSVSVTFDSTLPVNELPVVSLSVSAASVDVGGVVTLTAAASDSDGTVDKVDFYVAGTLVGTAATAPYALDFTATAAGSVSVYAKVTDNLGATADSTPVALTVIGEPVANNCRPDGLYQTEGVSVPYCYDLR